MIGSNIKQTIIIILYAISCVAISIAFVRCSERRADAELQKINNELEDARREILSIKSQNDTLNDSLIRTNRAFEILSTSQKLANIKNEERIKIVKNDDSASDWLNTPVPASLRDAFKDYCGDQGDTSSDQSVDSMCKTESLPNQDQ